MTASPIPEYELKETQQVINGHYRYRRKKFEQLGPDSAITEHYIGILSKGMRWFLLYTQIRFSDGTTQNYVCTKTTDLSLDEAKRLYKTTDKVGLRDLKLKRTRKKAG